MLRNDGKIRTNMIGKIKKENAASVLCFSVMVLLLAGNLIFSYAKESVKLSNAAFVIIVSITAYLLPSAISLITSRKNAAAFFSMPRKGTSKFCVISALLLIFSAILTKSVVYYINGESAGSGELLAGTGYFEAIVCYAVLPAVLEELVFRGVAFSLYEKSCGGAGAILATSFFFGMSHFSAGEFISYFISGIILGTVVYISRSVIPAIIMHMFNNLAGYYLENAVFKISSENKSGTLAIFLMTAISLVFLFFVLTEAENICRKRYLSCKIADSGQVETETATVTETETEEDNKAFFAAPRLIPNGMKIKSVALRIIVSPFLWTSFLLFAVYIFIK